LAEDLEQIELSPEIEVQLGAKAATVAKLIKTGKANGPIVEAFKRIQATDGDDAAYEYLRVEADGFHATPYGHCLNSFTVDPCPKHLECFSGCRHLSATNLPENREHLIRLENRLQSALEAIRLRASSSLKQSRIDQMETMVALLTASHVALLRSLGELGGFAKWAAFYERFREARDALQTIGAIPAENESRSTS